MWSNQDHEAVAVALCFQCLNHDASGKRQDQLVAQQVRQRQRAGG
jgi:hypothetical protein